MAIESIIYTFEQRDQAHAHIAQLLDAAAQFAVTPFPDDMNSMRATGWRVSWPAIAAPAPADQPEPGRAAA